MFQYLIGKSPAFLYVDFMTECLAQTDLEELSRDTLEDFDQRLSQIPPDTCASFHEEATRLEGELLTLYRVVLQCVKKEENLERVANWWQGLMQVCDKFAERLNKLIQEHPSCGADFYYDRVLDLRNKCHRLQKMHN